MKSAQISIAITWLAGNEYTLHKHNRILFSYKKRETMENLDEWMKLENIIPNEVTQTQKYKYTCFVSYSDSSLKSLVVWNYGVILKSDKRQHLCGGIFLKTEGMVLYIYVKWEQLENRKIKGLGQRPIKTKGWWKSLSETYYLIT